MDHMLHGSCLCSRIEFTSLLGLTCLYFHFLFRVLIIFYNLNVVFFRQLQVTFLYVFVLFPTSLNLNEGIDFDC